MTSGRNPFADDPDLWQHDAGTAPAYGPPGYGPPTARTPTYGLPATRVYGPDAWHPVTDPDWSPAPIAPAAPAARPRRRGQWLAWTVLVLAVVASAALGAGVYQGLAGLRGTGPDPWGAAWAWLPVVGAAAVATVVVVLLGLVALAVSRPKLVAALATLVALVLPVVVGKYALTLGLEAAARHGALDGAALLDLVTAGLDRLGAAAGPARDVVEWVLRQVVTPG